MAKFVANNQHGAFETCEGDGCGAKSRGDSFKRAILIARGFHFRADTSRQHRTDNEKRPLALGRAGLC
jgi:hypothetical protein